MYSTRTNPQYSNIWGIFEGKRKKRKAEAYASMAEQDRLTMEKEAALEIEKAKAGILSSGNITALTSKLNTTTYIILGICLVLIVGLTMYFKFRKK